MLQELEPIARTALLKEANVLSFFNVCEKNVTYDGLNIDVIVMNPHCY